MKANRGVLLTVFGLICLTVPVFAHHGFDTEYDQSKKLSTSFAVAGLSFSSMSLIR